MWGLIGGSLGCRKDANSLSSSGLDGQAVCIPIDDFSSKVASPCIYRQYNRLIDDVTSPWKAHAWLKLLIWPLHMRSFELSHFVGRLHPRILPEKHVSLEACMVPSLRVQSTMYLHVGIAYISNIRTNLPPFHFGIEFTARASCLADYPNHG